MLLFIFAFVSSFVAFLLIDRPVNAVWNGFRREKHRQLLDWGDVI